MSTAKDPYEQPLNSQCESSSPQGNHPPRLQRKHSDPSCKISPFKPNSLRKRKLPFPTLTPIPIKQEDVDRSTSLLSPKRGSPHGPHCSVCSKAPSLVEKLQPSHHRSSLLHQDQVKCHLLPLRSSTEKFGESAPAVPPDIDVPSPPALSSSSDEHENEIDIAEYGNSLQRPVKPPQQKESPIVQVSRHISSKTDTCDPPQFSQDSAFFSFSNAQEGQPNDYQDRILPSQEPVEGPAHEQNITATSQARKRYYTRAFDYVITEVLERYRFILPSQDVDIARVLRDNLSGNAHALFVRIYSRKQPQWYRVSKLEQAYSSEIDVRAGIEELCREHFLISSMYALKGSQKSASLLARELLSVLELSELRSVCASIVDGATLKRFPRNRLLPALRKVLSKSQLSRQSKKKLMQTTLSGLRPSECLARAVLKIAGHTVRVPDLILSALKRMRFLFFLDDGHDSPNVILADTGKIKFPAYKCQTKRAIFPSSQALKDYESAIELEQWIDEALEDKDWSRAAYFGSIAELEVREFFQCGEDEKEERLSNPFSSTAGVMASRRPALTKRINREEQLEQLNHPFLRRYSAQWVFVRSCWHSVHALERLSEYESAVSRLKLLLSTNLMPRRRGKCLTRLTINMFKHLGALEEPLHIIISALSFPESHLHLGDQIGLAQRGAAIHAKLLAKSIPRESRSDARGKTGSYTRNVTTRNPNRPRVIEDTLEKSGTEVSVRKIFGKSLNVQKKEEISRISNIEDAWLRYVEENRGNPQAERLSGNLPITGKSVYLSQRGTGTRVSVEEYCLEWYYAKESLSGAHDEGKSVRFLFTLFLWECALFADVPDVFQTPYQDRPLDLYTEAFYSSRKESIDARLEEIASMSCDEIYAEALGRYQRFEATKAVGCSWSSYSSEDVAVIAAGLGGHGLAHCCRLLAKDYMYWGGGLPDLTLWGVDDDGQEHYKTKLVEVKSARDALSERQRAWLIELQSCGVESEVCKVVEKVTARNASQVEDSTLTPIAVNRLDGKEGTNIT